MVLNNYDIIIAISSRGKFLVQKMDSRETAFYPGLAAIVYYFFINTSMGNFHLPRCFHYVVQFIFFQLRHCYFLILFFLISCVCKVILFSFNNSIQSIVLVFCYKKVLLDLFNFLLQICNNIVMDNDR